VSYSNNFYVEEMNALEKNVPSLVHLEGCLIWLSECLLKKMYSD